MHVFSTLLLLAGVFQGPLRAQENSWAGKTILTKKNAIKIGYTGDDGKQVYLATLDGVDYRVLADQAGFILVKTSQGIQGWFDKSDAVVLEEAADFFTGVIKANPSDGGAYNRRAAVWHARGDLERALKDYDDAVRLSPDVATFVANRGNVWSDKKEYDKAIADYSAAIRLDPKNVSAYTNRGNAWSEKKEHDKAVTDHNEALRLDPKNVSAHTNRGNVFADQKEYGKALADYSEASRLDPKNANAYNSMAWLLATCPDDKIRDGKRALQLAQKALELDKKGAHLLDTLAAAHAETGNFEEAIRLQQRALEDPQLRNDAGVRTRLELYRKKQPYRQE